MPPAIAAAPDPLPVAPILSGVKVPPLTIDQLNKSFLSGVVYYQALASLQAAQTGIAGQNGNDVSDARAGSSFVPQPSLSIMPDASIVSTVNVTNDDLQDVEPSVMSINVGGVDRTTSTYIKYVAPNPLTARIQFASTTNFSTFAGGQLSLPGGYSLTGDPLMAINPYTGGIAPTREYCSGIAFNSGNPGSTPNAVAVWHSDDGGASWSSPTIADSRGSGYFLDKPAIAVSWHTGSLGYVYVAYASWDYVSNNTAIVVARSTDGGASFAQKTVVAYGQGPTGLPLANPQIVVAPGTGYVYVIWVNFATNDIRMARSTDFGVSYGAHDVVASGSLTRSSPALNGGIRASTVPMARFNTPSNKIVVVWHENGSQGTDVKYAYKPCTSVCNSYGWEQKKLITQYTANDQFMPALDFNASGNMVVTYYDRHSDSNNLLYRDYYSFINPTGTRLQNDQQISTFDSNPTTPQTFQGFIGDYKDIWDWAFSDGEKATAAWIGLPAKPGEVYLTRIAY
ncbi:MAG: sialidase family protein [Acidobacteriota bacterium]